MRVRHDPAGAPSAPAVSYPVGVSDFYTTNGTQSSDHAVFPVGPSMTRQEFAEECDINSIMKRYENTGASINGLTRHPAFPPMYVDFTAMPSSLMEYQQFMSDAAASFMTLPASVRKTFDNDPIAFCDFASDPANLDQMRAWDLAPAAPAPAYTPMAAAPAAAGVSAPGGVSSPPPGAPSPR